MSTVCKRPSCPVLVLAGRPSSPCPIGRACVYLARPRAKTTERGYGSAWARVSREYRAAHPHCEEHGCDEASTVVDHLDGRGPRGDNRWSNLEALCRRHHNERTLRYEGGWGNPKVERPTGMKRCSAHAACRGVS